jgi:hypothetical protein
MAKKVKPIINYKKSRNESIDELEIFILENFEPQYFPLVHRFTDGLYTREIEVPKGILLTSKVLKSQHQFFLLKGAISMWNDGGEEIYMKAPFIGITEANTRRVVYVWEDCVFSTTHPNPLNKNLEGIEEDIIDKYDNPLLTDEMKQRIKIAKEVGEKSSKLIDNK